MSHSKIKVLVQSNYSRLLTGFGKNMKNIFMSLHDDPDIELIEVSNGVLESVDTMLPWKSFGSYKNPETLKAGDSNQDAALKRLNMYGHFTIDEIVKKVKPDIFLGIEDIWAFREFEKKPWWDETKKIIWTTLDSLPIMDLAQEIASSCDKMLVWASFAEKEMRRLGHNNVETLHGAIDCSDFYPLDYRDDLRAKMNLSDSFVIGFVCKNQLRKSIPNLLDGFKKFQKQNPESKAKLLLHTDFPPAPNNWPIQKYVKEKNINPNDILCTYYCSSCGNYFIQKYEGENKDCRYCGSQKTANTKNHINGVDEKSLNEIYNIMDVYCHPFTSGGQELPIQEAKSAGLITLVTEYSCGIDSCYPNQGGLPLKWSEYREPSTQFIKASTDPNSICDQLTKVYNMSEVEKKDLLKKGSNYTKETFSCEKISKKLKSIILDVHKSKSKTQKKEDKQEEERKKISLKKVLGPEKASERILVVIPDSSKDVLMINSLIKKIKENYPKKSIYISTKKEYFSLIQDNPFVHKIIPYQEGFKNSLYLEGTFKDKGLFDIVFNPNIITKLYQPLSHIHNGNDIISFFKK